jgi:outer membrane protein OmpA-like peptidoglycan-associated protein
MKKNYILFSFVLLFTFSFAQNKATQKADTLFETYQYVRAIQEYLKLSDSKNANQYVFTQLADCYYNVFNATEASKWYAKAVTPKASAETYYKYAQTLKTLGNYEAANKQMDAFSALMPNDARAMEHKANPNYLPSLTSKSKLFNTDLTSIKNDGQSDFGSFLTNDNVLYFTSNRNKTAKTDKWINQPYLDIYKSTRSTDGYLSEPTAVSELNTIFHDGPVTISSDGNTMFFARDSHSEGQFQKDKSGKVKIGQQGLYKATKIDEKWTNIVPLPFNSVAYSVSNPSISKDGKTLYFASNMPGGFGESDIWKVAVEESGYGKPENLGSKINSSERENFPFITDDNVLYFSTSGKQGFGGLDVYKTDLNKSEEPQNVGKPVNSEKDDFSFSFNSKANVGYFSSNRNGTDAIFSASPVCLAESIVMVTNKKTGAILSNATISILDAKGNSITNKQTDANGKASFDIDCNTDYSLLVKASSFDAATFQIKKIASGKTTVNAQLDPSEVVITETEVILKNIYFDFDKSNITAQGATELDKLVMVMTENPKMIIYVKSHTDSKGTIEYNSKLSEQRAQSTVQYVISKGISGTRISGKGFGSSEPKIDCKADCTEEQHAENRRSEFLIVKK